MSDATAMVKKYRELFFIPILLTFLSNERHRTWAWAVLTAVSVVSLLASYLIYWDVFGLGKPGDPTLKNRITHSLFMAFFAYYCLHKFYDRERFALYFLLGFLLTLFNLFFIVEGRTGQLIVLALIALFAAQRFTLKGQLLAALALVACLGLFLGFSEKANRIMEGFTNTQSFLNEEAGQTRTSMGQRYTFWKYSLRLIAEKPLIGHGTGSFAGAYRRIAADEPMLTENPHNELLMVGVQLGLLGLIPYLGFFISQAYYAQRLAIEDKRMAQGVLVALLITSLFNTPFLDHTEGHWFAFLIALCFASLQKQQRISPIHA